MQTRSNGSISCSSSVARSWSLSRRARIAGVDARMERLHAAAEHLGEIGQRLDALDRQAEALEVAGGAAARDEAPAELGEPAREDVEAGLVEGRDQRAHSSSTTRGSRRCSIPGRGRAVSRPCRRASTGTRSCASIGPAVDALVDVVHRRAGLLDARRQLRLRSACAPGNSRQQRGMDVDDARRGTSRKGS